MERRRALAPFCGFAIGALLTTLAGSAANAALVSTTPGSTVTIGDETAVVLWDPATHTEHLIDRVTFRNDSGAPIAFVVPTPTPPQINPAPDDPSRLLNHAYHPAYVHLDQTGIRPVSAFAWGLRHLSAMTSNAPGSGAQAMETWTNADYQTTSLSASAPGALSAWLHSQQFAESPGMQSWLKPYADRQMSLTAYTIAPSRAAGRTIRPPLIALTFQTDHPFFPNRRLPADTGASDERSRVRVYLISNNRLQATSMPGSPSWTGATSWAVPLPADLAARLNDNLTSQLGGVRAPALTQPWVSVFQEDTQPGSTGADLEFQDAADQSALHPVVTIRNDRRFPIPFDALFFLGSLVLAFRRRSSGRQGRRAARPEGQPAPALAGDEPPASQPPGTSVTSRAEVTRPDKPRKRGHSRQQKRPPALQHAVAAPEAGAPVGESAPPDEGGPPSKSSRHTKQPGEHAAPALTSRQKNKLRKHKNHFGEMLRDAFRSEDANQETVSPVKDPARNLTAPWNGTETPPLSPINAGEEAGNGGTENDGLDYSALDLPAETDASLWIDIPAAHTAAPKSFSLHPTGSIYPAASVDFESPPSRAEEPHLHDAPIVTLYPPRRSPFKRRKRAGEEPVSAPTLLADNTDLPEG